MDYQGIEIERPNHDTVILSGPKTVVIDPFKVDDLPKADLVLITHDHYDHLSLEDLAKAVDPGKTTIIAAQACGEKLGDVAAKKIELVEPGDQKIVDGINIHAVPAYNTNKFKAPGQPFHPKEAGYVGFVVTINGTNFYHTGDTDFIDEMKALGPIDVMFVPVSGTYVMTAEEAAEAVAAIKPKIAVPMHYGAIVGSDADATKFKSLVKNCRVEIVP